MSEPFGSLIRSRNRSWSWLLERRRCGAGRGTGTLWAQCKRADTPSAKMRLPLIIAMGFLSSCSAIGLADHRDERYHTSIRGGRRQFAGDAGTGGDTTGIPLQSGPTTTGNVHEQHRHMRGGVYSDVCMYLSVDARSLLRIYTTELGDPSIIMFVLYCF